MCVCDTNSLSNSIFKIFYFKDFGNGLDPSGSNVFACDFIFILYSVYTNSISHYFEDTFLRFQLGQ